jgi:hypothetical protein
MYESSKYSSVTLEKTDEPMCYVATAAAEHLHKLHGRAWTVRISKRAEPWRLGIYSGESIPTGWESVPGLLKRFTNSGSDIPISSVHKYTGLPSDKPDRKIQ